MKQKILIFTLIVSVLTGIVAATPTVESVSISPEEPGTWEKVDVTVEGSDDGKILNAQLYWDGEWHTESCNTFATCEKTFEIMPTKEKTYTLKARIQDSSFQLSDEKEREMVVSDDAPPEVTSLELPENPEPGERVSIRVSAEDDEKVTSTQVYWDGNWYSQPCDSSSCENVAKFTPTQDREYTVKARAIDSGDQYSEKVEKTLVVGTGGAPTVESVSVSDSTPDEGERFDVDVEAEDNDEVLNIQAYWDGEWYTKQCGSASCEKSFTFLASQAGTYDLKIRAQDTSLDFSETETEEIEVQESSRNPYVSLESPLNTEVGTTPRLEWDSGDPDDSVTNKVYIDDDSTPFRGPMYTENVGDDESHEVPSGVLERGEEYTWGVETTGGEETVEDMSSFTVREKDTDESPQVKWIDVESNPSVDEKVTIEARAEDDGKLLNLQFRVDGKDYTETCDTLYSCERSIEFTPDSGGTYEVDVRAQDAAFHLSSWSTESFHVSSEAEEDPNARLDVYPDPAEVGERVTFDATESWDNDGHIDEYRFDLDNDGDNEVVNSDGKVDRSFGSPRDTKAVVTVVDNDGRTDTASEYYTVNEEEGRCSYSLGNMNLGEDVIQRGESTTASIKVTNSGDAQKFRVRIKEGGNTVKDTTRTLSSDSSRTFSTSVSPSDDTLISAVIETEGSPCGYERNVRSQELIVVSDDDNGDEDRPPVADFTVSDSSPDTGQTVSFDASSSTDPDGDIVSYSWNFGDGSSASGSNVQHSYSSEGSYTVSLQVKDSQGNTDTATRRINVAEETGSCGVSVSSNLGLSDDHIAEGETSEASLTVYNSGDPQKVRVEFREGTNTVKAFEETISGDKTFRAEVSPEEDTLVNARVSTEGAPCGSEEWIRSKEIIVVEEQEAFLRVNVEDEDGEPLRNALVTVNGEQMRETDSDGDASFSLESGTHEVKVTKSGYGTESRSVTLSSGESRTIDFELSREEIDRDLEIVDVGYDQSVCRGDTLPVDVTVENTGNQADVISVSASGLGSNIQEKAREIGEGETETWTVRFTNVEGSGDEEFRVSATNTDSHTVEREVEVENCGPAPSERAERISMELQPRETISGDAVKVRGFVDGTTSRTEVSVEVDGGEKARVSTQPDGYFETYIRVEEVGKHTVSATTEGASTSRELEVFPTASVSFVDTPREVFEGENFELCTEVRSQIEPKLVLFEDGKIVRTKTGKGDVCFDLSADRGEHEYKVRALTYGEGGEATANVNVLETDVEAKSFPSQIATVESGSGIVKIELYNTHEDLRRYDLELEGLPDTWVSQSEKQVILTKGERKEIYFYLTPQEEGSFEPVLSVSSKDGEIYREELPVITGGTTKPQKKSLWQRFRDVFFY